jgi:uncharacterized protein YbjT (DUF2867 family)
MKVVVIGGTGLIGSKVVSKLRQLGHEAIAASPASGVNTITGEGLADVLVNADVVVDVANSPNFEDNAAMEFFQTAGRNLFAAEAAAGVKHHVALSVVGTDRLLESGYFRAKQAQEDIIKRSGIPYTIVHSTQFFEFLGSIAAFSVQGETIHLPPAPIQPIASDDVAAAVADAAAGQPVNGIVEIAGPERVSLSGMVQRYLDKVQDTRMILEDNNAKYFGVTVDERSLVPGDNPRIGQLDFEAWFAAQPKK